MHIPQKFTVASIIISVFIGYSCDILRISPFEVTSWTPGEGFHRDFDVVSVTLSHESDASSVEHAFSLTQNGVSVRGVFTWQDKTLFFTPAVRFETNADYEISVSTDAHDTQGLSLDRKFEARFTTRPPGERPALVSIHPPDSGILSGEWEPVTIMFSCPVPLISCVDSISFSPSKSGSWQIENETAGVFTPLDPWENGDSYNITIGADFKNTLGLPLDKEETSRFSIGSDNTPPAIAAVYAVTPAFPPDASVYETLLVPDDAVAETSWTEHEGWESNSRLRIVFSEPVDVSSVKSRVVVEPQASLVMDAAADHAETVDFSFAKRPVFESRFLFRITPGIKDTAGNMSAGTHVYRVYANGVHSKPPRLIGIRLPLAPMPADADQRPAAFPLVAESQFAPFIFFDETSSAPYETEIPFWIELYFETARCGAESAGIDLFSLMDAFSVNATNSAFSFSPRLMVDGNFTVQTAHSGWESYTRVEIRGKLINTIHSGVITFQIDAGLSDSWGSVSDAPMMLVLVK
ncbi:MAG: Ig-like domain-containing protein [Treponema sp.]|jgi:hypothetical protein|nr:Ig-like domain-containing protein [Treponema sp.]